MYIDNNCGFILSALENAGFSAYIVGGCVRDMLMDIPIHDYDITTNALPDQIIEVFSSCKVIPTGIKHGTVTVIHNNEAFEVTTFRIDGDYSDSRRPDSVVFTDSLTADLARRDFTMNAIAMDIKGNIFDPFNGKKDISDNIIRCVGEPSQRFTEDALRILRAVRFSAVLGFEIEKNTSAAIHNLRSRLDNISAERISAELMKLICGKNVLSVLMEYRDIIGQIIPELIPAFDHDQHSPYHKYDVYEHIVRAVDSVQKGINGENILRLTMLLHDVGKPDTFKLDENGRGHFKRHAVIGAEKAEAILRRLKFDNNTINTVHQIILYHSDKIETDKQIKRMVGSLGLEKFLMLIEAKIADNSAKHSFVLEEIKDYRKAAETARNIVAEDSCFSLSQLEINGSDLLELGFSGKNIGIALNNILELVIDEKLDNNHDILINYAKELKI